MFNIKYILNFINSSSTPHCVIKGLYGSAKAMVLADVCNSFSKQNETGYKQNENGQNLVIQADENESTIEERGNKIHFVIEESRDAAEYFCADLYSLYDSENIYFFPTSSATGKSVSIKDSSDKVLRSIALNAISNFNDAVNSGKKGENIIIVSYPDAVKEGIPSVAELKKNTLHLVKNEEVLFDSIKEFLIENNFERVDYVEQPGQFAIRGSIIDLFSYSNDKPYRLDFFGDTIESIKIFDINTQRSVNEIDSLDILPDSFSGNHNSHELSQIDSDISIFELLQSDSCIIWNNSFENLYSFLGNKKIINLQGKNWEGIDDSAAHIEYRCSPQPTFNKNFLLLAEDIIRRNSEGYRVFISSSSKEQIERLTSIFSDASLSQKFLQENTPHFEPLYYPLHEGFVSSDEGCKICVYTDHQIFERYHRVKIKREIARSEKLTIEDLNSYHVGDYIVHIDHGVGVFGGLAKTQVNGKLQEVVKLMYKDGDVIFLSVHSLHKIAKYKSADGVPPKIYKLGSGAWNRLKQNTKSKIKDIAKDLIALYSKRRQAQGFAFAPDSYMQKELEASFMWEDTPDQLKATEDVKADMERSFPMDRLICGDVGFGKTEVAIRGAFKAVCDSKQVCILVPTTILALQHYKTFTERLEKFPVTIDYVSRLRTTKEIAEVQKNIKSGKIDIVIGTHRLLNKKIEFKDLGLLIIDEEQKFGVSAKERLRELKVEVDTLTLTATPIPRTLQFSLLGARDLSIINTPPPNRLPVQTEIIDFKEEYIKQAIENELNRGGQVFFVHNRVEDILSVEQMINRICPRAKTITGHGKMEPKTLENRILEFIRGDYDILISTTIIENGIDIPNANTMIINQAQMFGLSDLHQLRGRVGRSNVKAFCYLIVPPITSITEDAKRRLKAIEAFSELGSGFNIAMQDLDIRGAGNLLGGEQSGFIADMGFETYQRILNEAFVEINAELSLGEDKLMDESQRKLPKNLPFVSDVLVDTDLELFIPEEYVVQPQVRIKLYRELDTISSEEQIKEFIESIEDKYGKAPNEVLELINVVRIRRLALKLGFEKVVIKQKTMLLYFVNNSSSSYFRSEVFAGVIEWIKERRDCRWREEGGKSWIKIPMVTTIEQGVNILKNIYSTFESS